MRFVEFANADSEQNSLVVAVDQLKSDLDSGKLMPEMPTDLFLRYLRKYGVFLDTSNLYDMYQEEPFSGVIQDVNDRAVTFKGQDAPEVDEPQDEKQQTVKQMADRAAKLK